MNKTTHHILAIVLLISTLGLAACGGGGGEVDDKQIASVFRCPSWEQGEAVSYTRSETVVGITTDTQLTAVVTARDGDSVSVSDGKTSRLFALASDEYQPVSELDTVEYGAPNNSIVYPTVTYESSTPLCPPPGVDESYAYTTFVPGPNGRGGYLLSTTLTVTAISDETVSVPAGNYSARKVVMNKTSGDSDSILSRYYVDGLGVVKEVEEIAATDTTITRVLNAYDKTDPALGTASNPIVITAGSNYQNLGLISYVARVGTGSLHFRLATVAGNTLHAITLSQMTDNADLYVYTDANFTSEDCRSMNTASNDESCIATSTAEGELYIRVEGGATTAGTDFVLRVENTD